MASVLARAVRQKPHDWELPILACQALGGDAAEAVAAMAAFACTQISIVLIDDLLDVDPRGEHHRVGAPAAANMAVAFQAAAIELLVQSTFAQPVQYQMVTRLNAMVLDTAYGQYLDTQNPEDEDRYWKVVRTKSAPFFAAALEIGALAAGAEPAAVAYCRRLGELYGEMVQIHDDLHDAMAQPANPDWIMGRSPLPLLFARVVTHPEQERFRELCLRMDEDALPEAQNILLRSGAVSYCVDQIVSRYRQARQLLAAAQLPYPEPIQALFDDVVTPVESLLASIGSGGQHFNLRT